MLDPIMYALGWLIHVLLQMENSLASPSNGLTNDWAGRRGWLKVQGGQLMARAFLAVVLYLPVVQIVTKKIAPALESSGLSNFVWGYAGLAGFSASEVVYQVLGWIPSLRAEMAELAPTAEFIQRKAAAVEAGTVSQDAHEAAQAKAPPDANS
jgi:hypothetical protein